MICVGERVDTCLGVGVVVGHEEHYGTKYPIVQLDDPTRWACWDGVHYPVFRTGKDISTMTPNAKVSGAGTASAGLPGYAPAHDGEQK